MSLLDRWTTLPEWLRWVLLFPTVFLVSALAVLLMPILFWLVSGAQPAWAWYQFFWYRIVEPAVVTSAVVTLDLEVLFALTPRGKRTVGWVSFGPLAALIGIALLLLVARRLGSWGFLGERMLPPHGTTGWEPDDWNDLSKTVAWLVTGTGAFRRYLTKAKEELRVAAAPYSSSEAPSIGLK